MPLDTAALANIVAGGAPSSALSGISDSMSSQGNYGPGALDALTALAQGRGGGETATANLPQVLHPAGPAGASALNVPYGAAYFDPVLKAIIAMLGLNQSGNQFASTQEMNAGQQLAGLSAQGGSAAELAYRRANLGLPAMGGNQDIADLIVNATQGAKPLANTIGDFHYTLPSTLTGRQTTDLQSSPNTQNVIGSYARAAGDPDYLTRSISALLPSGFQGTSPGVYRAMGGAIL